MRNQQRLKYYYLSLIFAISFFITGCGDGKTTSPSTSDSAKEVLETKESTEEYNYGEFINDTDVDLSELEKEDISLPEAEIIVESGEGVRKAIRKFEKKYRNDHVISRDNLYDYLYELQEYLYTLNLEGVSYYELYDCYIGVYFTYDVGTYIYSPSIEGMDAGFDSKKMDIATYQPFYSSYGKSVEKYMSYPDDAADQIVSEFSMYQFDNRDALDDRNFDDDEVTFANILNFGKNNVIFWHGHGGNFGDSGCVMATGVKDTAENMKKYYNELQSGALVRGYSEGENIAHYCVTPLFFETYLPDGALENSIIYLGTCSSGANSSLIDVMLEKGAMAVFANSGTIETKYNLKMMKIVSEGMTRKSGSKYYTLSEALEYAQKKNGTRDSNGTYVYVTYGVGCENISLDWYEDYRVTDRDVVLLLDHSGSMAGEPILETKKAASDFVDTVFETDTRVALVTYDDEATINCRLTRNDNLLKTKISEVEPAGSTNMYSGMEYAEQLLQKSSAKKKIIVLMSDGLPNLGPDDGTGSCAVPLVKYTADLKKQGYYIYTLGFFTSVDSTELFSAQQLMENISSPGLHYEVDSADDLVFFFDDIANQISGTKYVYIRIACPVDVTVTCDGETLSSEEDNENTRTSFGTLTYETIQLDEDSKDDISGDDHDEHSSWSSEETLTSQEQVKILRLKMDKDYDVQIEGYDNGTMDYSVNYPDKEGEYTDVREFPDIAVSSSTKAVSNTERTDTTYLKVDKNGDGKYETTYETKSNGKMEKVKSHTILYICFLVVGTIIITTIVIIVIVIKKSKKKKSKKEIIPIEGKKKVRGFDQRLATGAVVGLFGNFSGQVFSMQSGISCVVGRESSCDIQLLHKRVSRVHCTILLLPDGMYQVVDCSSTGTYYNNQRLEKGKPYILPRGALLVIGEADNVLQLQQ